MNDDAIMGCILGTAVADALGLPYEGVSRDRAPRLLGRPSRHRFLFGRGMISDDTEHTCMVAQSLIEAGDDVALFVSRFAWRLKWWGLLLPAGVGLATARSILKLWLGVPPSKSGVFSAGNGPAMRAAIFGAAIHQRELMLEFVCASSRLTHSDPKAEYGAVTVALAARESRLYQRVDANRFMAEVVTALGDAGSELTELLDSVTKSVACGEPTRNFAASMGLENGVTGYTYHTVPVAIHAWLSHSRNYAVAVTAVIECGGDTDTTAAIVGGIIGSGVGCEGIDPRWLDGIIDRPRSVPWMKALGRRLEQAIRHKTVGQVPRINPLAVLLRNLLFLIIVLFHGFRRLAPPY